MPELPEVEVTRRGLAAALDGATVRAVRMGKRLRWPLGREPQALVGLRCGAMRRRGKYLWLPLGPGDGGLLLHLGMSGSLGLLRDDAQPGPHDHFDLLTDRGCLRLTDPRRFGAVVWSPALDQEPARSRLAGLGVEPLDGTMSAQAVHAALAGRRAPIKQVLLAGEVVVGAGNIYACEALFLAGIDPRTPAGALGPRRVDRLVSALHRVLSDAVAMGGSSLRDYRNAAGGQGRYQTVTRVYGRQGQPCAKCGTAVRRIVMGQRASYFCPRCQRR